MNEVQQESKRRQSNGDKILAHLQTYGQATNAELLKLGSFRYGARLKQLRDSGYKIETIKLKGGLFLYKYLGKVDEPEVGEQLGMIWDSEK